VAVTEEARHELYTCFKGTMGAGWAATMIDHLPPGGWTVLATKDDLARLEERIEGKFDRFEGKLHRELRNQMMTLVATNLGLLGLAMAAVKLF
jgi:hypothetical protein